MASKLLFLLRHRDQPWGAPYGYGLSSGLRNSVRFVVDMLHLLGIPAEWQELPDDNVIDKAVKAYNPTHVILEAFWVRPAKIDVLRPLHPYVTWIVRDHSETPFLANEGLAFSWVAGYLSRGVEIACNAPRALTDMQAIGTSYGYPNLISYAPNYYPVHTPKNFSTLVPKPPRADDTIKIGCFGAIRPLKNQAAQAIAALRFAEVLGKKLEFHINSARTEQGGNPVLKNLQAMFANSPRATLVELPWVDHETFLETVAQMDIVMQVSFTETFNIVSADAVACSVPVVASSEVSWLQNYALASANSTTSILEALLRVMRQPRAARLSWQMRDLNAYCQASKKVYWDRFGRGGPVPV
jgi:glycosyltransferase involved in cell wall biosynthesis